MAVLSARGLAKRYGRAVALDHVDIEVAEGEVVGLLGPNGAGKSTLAKIVCGLVRATEGSAIVAGHPAGSRPARSAIGYLAELFRFPAWCTAEELLELHQRLAGAPAAAAERRRLLSEVGLAHAADVRVGAMSKGMQQRLGLAQALVGSPRLLMLDEPTSALDPAGRRTVRDLLKDVRERGVAVLLSSHLLGEVELVCDRVVILDGGRRVAEGTPAELSQPRGVEVETESGRHVYEGVSRDDVPALVERLVASGERVYGVRALAATLEDVYLERVGGEER